jgi:hypothetical protein
VNTSVFTPNLAGDLHHPIRAAPISPPLAQQRRDLIQLRHHRLHQLDLRRPFRTRRLRRNAPRAMPQRVARLDDPVAELMRVVVAAACVLLAVGAASRRKPLAIAPLIFVALFMLFVKGLSKGTWQVIDLGVAVLLIGMGAWLTTLEVRD